MESTEYIYQTIQSTECNQKLLPTPLSATSIMYHKLGHIFYLHTTSTLSNLSICVCCICQCTMQVADSPQRGHSQRREKTTAVHSDVLCSTVHQWLELGGQGYLHPLCKNNPMLTNFSLKPESMQESSYRFLTVLYLSIHGSSVSSVNFHHLCQTFIAKTPKKSHPSLQDNKD